MRHLPQDLKKKKANPFVTKAVVSVRGLYTLLLGGCLGFWGGFDEGVKSLP